MYRLPPEIVQQIFDYVNDPMSLETAKTMRLQLILVHISRTLRLFGLGASRDLQGLQSGDTIHMGIDGRFVLGDFGLATEWPRNDAGFEREGDKQYLAAEVLQGVYGKAADIFRQVWIRAISI